MTDNKRRRRNTVTGHGDHIQEESDLDGSVLYTDPSGLHASIHIPRRKLTGRHYVRFFGETHTWEIMHPINCEMGQACDWYGFRPMGLPYDWEAQGQWLQLRSGGGDVPWR